MASVDTAQRGIVCLANDSVVEWLEALCQSLARHSPGLPLTLIPFDDNVEATRTVLDRHGFEMFDMAGAPEVDIVGNQYWPNAPIAARALRKFAAWNTYETFLFLDADVVVLRDLERYFEAFEHSSGQFMYFHDDLEQVYRPGAFRDRMVAEHASVGFNSGIFMSRRGWWSRGALTELASRANDVETRAAFVDNLEQSFMNFCVDSTDMPKVDANVIVAEQSAAAAMMRLTTEAGAMVLRDHRVPYSGRPVSMIHWAGYSDRPFVPYRDVFLRYRLPGSSRLTRARHEVRALVRVLRQISLATLSRRLRGTPYVMRSWLSARGLVAWHGSRS